MPEGEKSHYNALRECHVVMVTLTITRVHVVVSSNF